jgi:DNA (cytosine-5)-methyltransferase 1
MMEPQPLVEAALGGMDRGESWVALPCRPLNPGDAWPASAYNVGAGRFAVEASDKPISRIPGSITRFRSPDWLMLSDRALNGFVKRAKTGGLRFPDGFLSALIEADRRQLAA